MLLEVRHRTLVSLREEQLFKPIVLKLYLIQLKVMENLTKKEFLSMRMKFMEQILGTIL